uniref:C-type lectin domain-containing protein n=1 Tax=Stegastes partitus TaxID=144197 RepID=A0A3B5A1N7_9TELE
HDNIYSFTRDLCEIIGAVALSFTCEGFATDLSERFVLGSGSMDWVSAQAHCRNQNTGLARVRNQEENELLQKMASQQRVWIGMVRMSWTWLDGSEASFVPWKPSHPLSGGDANCAVLDVNSGTLGVVDKSCAEKHPFFCYSSENLDIIFF